MSYQFTAEEAVEEAADVLGPIFRSNRWRWANSDGGMSVPDRERIEEKVRGMIEELSELDDRVRMITGGRIMVHRRREHGPGDHDWTYRVGLKLSVFPDPEPDEEELEDLR